jgi:hypothetical protein
MPIEGKPGEHILDVAKRAVEAARREGGAVVLEFNGARVPVEPHDTADAVYAKWDAEMEARRRAYWTPERTAARDAEHARDRAAVAEHEATLDVIDLAHQPAAIRWLCRMEEMAKVHAPFSTSRVLQAFFAAGYGIGGYCSVPGESEAEWAARVGLDGRRRWLIGQALDGVRSVGAPHGVIHKFAADLIRADSGDGGGR